jgi:glycosyltransferase involved in cell wall biosynthesis
VPSPVLQVFYSAASVFASPSLHEGFGLSPLEAMANGTPVVASNTASLPEVLEDAAILVNPENVFEIARAIKQVLLDRSLQNEMVNKGRQQVEKFSWKTAARRVVETYEAVTTKQSVAAPAESADGGS